MNKNREVLDRLFDDIVWRFHEFNEFKELYYHSDLRVELLDSCLQEFSSELFYMYMEKISIGVSRLTDPVKSDRSVVSDKISFSINLKGRRKKASNKRQDETLSIYYVDNILRKAEAKYPVILVDALLAQIKLEVADVRKLRNKRFAHNDLKSCVSNKEMLFYPSKIESFYNLCQKYLTLIFESLYGEPCPIHTNGNVGYLIKALKGYKVSEALFFNDIARYDELESTMQWDDA
ncbi:hypothetical protein [Vibrio parahaemolyticus]|uniref:hypothetical protein n=1 Tax=Vibrio parahaemolyticus TaxID=670 RepID=UPI0031FE4439